MLKMRFVVYQAKLDLGFFQETNVPDGIHMYMSADYRVHAVDAPRCHRGGVAIFLWDAPHFQVEAFQPYGPNMKIFQLDYGGRI